MNSRDRVKLLMATLCAVAGWSLLLIDLCCEAYHAGVGR